MTNTKKENDSKASKTVYVRNSTYTMIEDVMMDYRLKRPDEAIQFMYNNMKNIPLPEPRMKTRRVKKK